MAKRKRRGLTIDDVFNKKRYRCIMDLITTYSNNELEKRIKFSHLKYALVKDYKTKNRTEKNNMESFFNSSYHQKEIDKIKKQYECDLIEKETYLKLIELFSKSKLKNLKDKGILLEEIKFPSEQSLRNALGRIKKLDLIKPFPDKKGYAYYRAKNKGMAKYQRWLLHHTIDTFIPDRNEALARLQAQAMVYATLIQVQKDKN